MIRLADPPPDEDEIALVLEVGRLLLRVYRQEMLLRRLREREESIFAAFRQATCPERPAP